MLILSCLFVIFFSSRSQEIMIQWPLAFMFMTLSTAHNKMVDIAAGWHSTALTDDGEVYVWGRGEHGRLGFGENDKSSKMVQQKVHLLVGEDIVQKAVAGLRRINLDGLRWRVFDAKGQVLVCDFHNISGNI
ncbi:putative regulator of chromosome condensation 1/beta-lactamase-inhibitor protein II [Rosa chinensis]|uniref:Putative regulator of chromosome condensation 1/beta-lactamase-inhibitor protein II n=1 Tax=Rosa chinensis TaxID=74649 RepID=A0A2P6R707_ROSCH|nr:putative regulator of chromosome condensation 1/beta-lactamase-inhibitor protein II [Rosa chinensis]